jgi:hypothetical protein
LASYQDPTATGITAQASTVMENLLHGPTLEQKLGTLNRWDAYFTSCNDDAFNTFYANSALKAKYAVSPVATTYGELFLRNLPLVKVLLTDARKDLVIYSDAIPPSFLRYKDLVAAINVDRTCSNPLCDGHLKIQMKTANGQPASQSLDIRYPSYPESGHMVSWTMPDKLLSDVKDWLAH